MAKYRKKPIVIEAERWFFNGDHSKDGAPTREGKVVRYHRHPRGDADLKCKHCNIRMERHGWIDTLEGGHIVCPGDWIITGIKGEYYPCKPHIFDQTYEKVEDNE